MEQDDDLVPQGPSIYASKTRIAQSFIVDTCACSISLSFGCYEGLLCSRGSRSNESQEVHTKAKGYQDKAVRLDGQF